MWLYLIGKKIFLEFRIFIYLDFIMKLFVILLRIDLDLFFLYMEELK